MELTMEFQRAKRIFRISPCGAALFVSLPEIGVFDIRQSSNSVRELNDRFLPFTA
jgi:hypothetical protein